MKVVLLMRGQSDVPGSSGVPGGQIGMLQLARALSRLGVDVHVFVSGPHARHACGFDDVGATHFNWPGWVDKRARACPGVIRALVEYVRQSLWRSALSRTLRRQSPDVLHVQGLRTFEILPGSVPCRIVVTHWGRSGRWNPGRREPFRRNPAGGTAEKVRREAVLVAIGEAQGDELAAVGLTPAAVVPPGVDLEQFKRGDRRRARESLRVQSDADMILYVGRLSEDKGVSTFMEACSLYVGTARSARFVIVGDGPLSGELRGLAGKLGIEEFVEFVPFVPHDKLPVYYQAADLLVVPSCRLETFCMVALEAIACECPLLVSDQVPEIREHFPHVPSVTAGDAPAMSAAFAGALRAEPPRACDTALSRFGWGSIAQNYMNLYENTTRDSGPH